MIKVSVFLCVCLGVLCTATTAMAIPTNITIRVKSKDAKFVGTSMGGVLITIKNADTGEELAKAKTTGSTGDTDTIMKTPHTRGMPIATHDTAHVTATINIDEPTLVEIIAYGPLSKSQFANRVSVTQWVIPGKHITTGDGWVLELPGFAVTILDPPAQAAYEGLPKTIAVTANITMMCGCPLTPGGMWDSNKYEIMMIAKKNGSKVSELPMKYAGTPSQFTTRLEIQEAGLYELTVYAYDPANGNTGLGRITFTAK